MGRFVDLNSPLSQEDKDYLEKRGRGYLIPANERRFGKDGTKEPAPHEVAGAAAQSPFYDTQERDRAVYDVGGAALPGTTLDYDTGRVLDRDNGVRLEPNLPNQPGHFATRLEPEGFTSTSDDEDDIDEDIVEEVLKLHVAGLKGRLTTMGVEVEADDKKADLQNKLAIALQDERDASKAK